MADLRRAVIWMGDQDTAWSDVELAALAGTDRATALRYVRVLVRDRALEEPVERQFRRGKGWKAWKSKPVTTKPEAGGNSRAYRTAKTVRDSVRQRAWEEAMASKKGGDLTCDRVERCDKRMQEQEMPIPKSMARTVEMLTTDEVASVLKVCRRTVLNLAKRKGIKPVRWSHSLVRYRASDVMKLAEESNE